MTDLTWFVNTTADDLLLKYENEYPQICLDQHGSFTGDEAKLLYCMIREVKPKVVQEIGCGVTTNIILEAFKVNGFGQLWTFALDRWHPVADDSPNWHWVYGDARQTIPENNVQNVDLYLIDAEHTADFCNWYTSNILDKCDNLIPVMIHDWIPGQPERWNTEEAAELDKWFEKNPFWELWHACGFTSGLSSTWIYKTEGVKNETETN